MKKTALFITIGVVVLSVSGYLLYERFLQPKKPTPWDLIPESTVAVYETSACEACVQPVKASALWQLITNAALYTKKKDSIQDIVGLLTGYQPGTLASMHVTKKDDFDFVFYFPVNTAVKGNLLMATLEEWKSKKNVRYAQRTYNSALIHELFSAGNVFSWTLIENIWVGSFTPFLIEDVVRVSSEDRRGEFRRKINDVYQMPKLKNDAGNLYVHLRNFSQWLSVFSPDAQLELVQHFGKSAVLDIKATDVNLVLNGFSLEDPQQSSVLSVFNGQFPTSFDLKQWVSNRTVALATFGVSEGKDFGEKLRRYPGRKASTEDTLRQVAAAYQLEPAALYAAIDNEVGVCYVETAGSQLSRILLIETSDAEKWLGPLNAMAEKLSTDTVFFEPYAGYEIRQLPLYRFPEKLLAPLVNGFDQCYYTTLGNTVAIGENLEELKSFLEDIDREETWGKSVAQNRFLESTLLESNISLYVNTPRIWNILRTSLNEKWNHFLDEQRSLVSSVGMGAIQFSHLNQSFYTNVAWQYQQPDVRLAAEPAKAETTITEFQHALAGMPWVVRSHMDKSNEVLLQDSAHQIHLVSQSGKVLWSMPMKSAIVGEVFQVDYFKNGKLQYFFATEGTLHIIDRLGNYVAPFPVSVGARNIEHVSLIDYDHSKNYRFLIADRSGKIWMYDKEGVNLEGWKPRNVGGDLFAAPRHHRIRGKDYLIAIREDGSIHLMNRRGEYIRGFPLKLDARPTGAYFLEPGSRIDNTYFVVVSRDGFRIKFNLEGKVQHKETLLKSSVEARFSLVREETGKSYIMMRQEAKGLSLINPAGQEILTNTYVGLNPVSANFFDFGAGKRYFMITDHAQDLTYLYDAKGDLLVSPPMEAFYSNLSPSQSGKMIVYLTYHHALVVKPLL